MYSHVMKNTNACRAALAAVSFPFALPATGQVPATMVVQAGDAVAGVPAGVTPFNFEVGPTNGEFALIRMSLEGPGVTSTNRNAYYAFGGGVGPAFVVRDRDPLVNSDTGAEAIANSEGIAVVRFGSPMPGITYQLSEWSPPGNEVFFDPYPLAGVPYTDYDGTAQFNRVFPMLAENDAGVFYRGLLEATNDFTNEGVWFADDTGPHLIVASEDSLPDLGAETVDRVALGPQNGGRVFVGVLPTVEGMRLDTFAPNPDVRDFRWYLYSPATGFELFNGPGEAFPPIPGAEYRSVALPFKTPSGKFVFNGVRLEIGPAGVTSANDEAVCVLDGAQFSVLVREGDPAPGVPGGVFSEFRSVAEIEDGVFAVAARMAEGVGGVTAADNAGIWIFRPDGGSLAVREDDAIPGVPGSTYGNLLDVTVNREFLPDGDFTFDNGWQFHYDGFNGVETLLARRDFAIPIVNDPLGIGERTLDNQPRFWFVEPNLLVADARFDPVPPGAASAAVLSIEIPETCFADVNGDGSATPADFNAWIVAFNSQSRACDQNADGLCTPADFNAWIVNFNTGCP